MSIFSSTETISKRSLTFNKSFIISLLIHLLLIFGISITTYYKLPIFKESPIINVKFANSNQDLITKTNLGDSFSSDLDLSISQNGNISSSKKTLQPYKVKKLQANSVVNTEEAVYLNLWQRQIETNGDNIISESKSFLDGRVQIMATIDVYGNLVKSEILISSGDNAIDDMAINIFATLASTISDLFSMRISLASNVVNLSSINSYCAS